MSSEVATRCIGTGQLVQVVHMRDLHAFHIGAMYTNMVRTMRVAFEAAYVDSSTQLTFRADTADAFSGFPRKQPRWPHMLQECVCGMGCTFVWVGIGLTAAWRNLTGIDELARNGVHTVWYETEPPSKASPCANLYNLGPFALVGENRSAFREVWTYTHAHWSKCPEAKYFPPGFVSVATCDAGPSGELAARPAIFGSLMFRSVGCVAWKQFDVHRRADMKLTRSGNSTSGALVEVFNVWDDAGFQRLATTHNAFVNIPRQESCLKHEQYHEHVTTVRNPCEAFRMSQLLSMGAFVVSEFCHPEDARAFGGLIEFPTGLENDTFPDRLHWWSELSTARRQAAILDIQARYRCAYWCSRPFRPHAVFVSSLARF